MDELISEQEFERDWRPSLRPSLRPSGDLFQFADVRSKRAQHVWTIVDSGSDADGSWYACPGFHLVNRLGYVLTQKAWSASTRDAVYFLDDFDHSKDEI